MVIWKQAVQVLSSRVVSSIVVFAGISFFAREIGSADLGVFFLFQGSISILGLVADLGVRGALEKRLSEGENRDSQQLGAAILLKGMSLLLLCGIILLLKGRINHYFGAEIASYLTIGLVLYETSLTIVKVLSGELQVGKTANLFILRDFFWIGGGVFLVLIGYSYMGLISSFLLALVMTVFYGILKITTRPARPEITDIKNILSYSKYNSISATSWEVYNWMDVLFIGYFLTTMSVSIYEVSWRVAGLVTLVAGSISKTLFPHFSNRLNDSKTNNVQDLITTSIAILALFSIPALIGGALLSRHILHFLFGMEFVAGSIVLTILLIEKVLQSGFMLLRRVLEGFNEPRLVARATVIAVISNLALNISLIPIFGLNGAAMATLSSSAINLAIVWIYVKGRIYIEWPYRILIVALCASTIMAILIKILLEYYHINSIWSLIVCVLFGFFAYTAMILPFRSVRNQLARALNTE